MNNKNIIDETITI